MAQDSTPNATPSTPVGTADVANASALVESVSVIRQALSSGSTAVIAAITAIATAVTQKLLGGVVGTSANRLLRVKTVSSGSSAGSVQNTPITCDDSGNLSGGTWQGTAVGAAYGGTGVANNAANTITFAGGNFSWTFTLSGNTNITFPTSGTMITTTGVQVLTNKTITYTAGTTSVAPLTLTSGANLTTAAAGAEEFDGTCFYATAAASSRQVVDTEQFTCLSGDYTLTDNSTAQKCFNASTNGALTVAASTSYFVEAMYLTNTTGTTAHTWSTLFAGTATLTSGTYQAMSFDATATSPVIVTAKTTTPLSALVVTGSISGSADTRTITLRGVLRINAGGTLIPQLKLSAGTGGTDLMLAGSFIRLWPIGSNSVTNVGAWS